MDPISLASAAMVALAPYLLKAGERVAEAIGKQAVDKAEAILTGLWARWRGKPDAEKRLLAYVDDPSTGRDAMTAALAVEVAGDPEFARFLGDLLDGRESPEIFIEQLAEKNGSLTGAEIRELFQGRLKILQTLKDGGTATALKADTLGRR